MAENLNIEIVIPGHGNISDKEELMRMKNYFVTIKNAKGKPEEIKKLKEKYKKYFSYKPYSSFEKTMEYVDK